MLQLLQRKGNAKHRPRSVRPVFRGNGSAVAFHGCLGNGQTNAVPSPGAFGKTLEDLLLAARHNAVAVIEGFES